MGCGCGTAGNWWGQNELVVQCHCVVTVTAVHQCNCWLVALILQITGGVKLNSITNDRECGRDCGIHSGAVKSQWDSGAVQRFVAAARGYGAP